MITRLNNVFLLFLIICTPLRAQGYSTKECIDLLSARIIINIPSSFHKQKENYEEGVIYFYTFKDGGCLVFHEGSMMNLDIDDYKPSKVVHMPDFSMFGGRKNKKFWKKYVCGHIRIYCFNVKKKFKEKYDIACNTITIITNGKQPKIISLSLGI